MSATSLPGNGPRYCETCGRPLPPRQPVEPIDPQDAGQTFILAQRVDALYVLLEQFDSAPDDDNLHREYVAVLLDALDRARFIRHPDSTVWSDRAEESFAEIAYDVPQALSLEELTEQIHSIWWTLNERAPVEADLGFGGELALAAMRVVVGTLVGALVAGPLCAAIPTTWIPWSTEPLKAAFGGGVGVVAAELTRPADKRLARRLNRREIGVPAAPVSRLPLGVAPPVARDAGDERQPKPATPPNQRNQPNQSAVMPLNPSSTRSSQAGRKARRPQSPGGRGRPR